MDCVEEPLVSRDFAKMWLAHWRHRPLFIVMTTIGPFPISLGCLVTARKYLNPAHIELLHKNKKNISHNVKGKILIKDSNHGVVDNDDDIDAD